MTGKCFISLCTCMILTLGMHTCISEEKIIKQIFLFYITLYINKVSLTLLVKNEAQFQQKTLMKATRTHDKGEKSVSIVLQPKQIRRNFSSNNSMKYNANAMTHDKYTIQNTIDDHYL